MLHRFARLMFLCLFSASMLSASAQDAPAITISPTAGEAETAVFAIEIDELQPDTRYQIAILFEGEVIFSSDETSDQAGHIYYPIASTAGDAPGAYTLRVSLNDSPVASAGFTLTEPKAAPADDSGDIIGDVTVSPETAPFGKAQRLRIADLAPMTRYTVEITARETSQVAYRRSQASDGEGLIEIEVFAEEGDAAGLHAIAVYDEAGELVAAGIFTILPPPQRDAAVTLSPRAVKAGDTVEIAVRGLAALDSVTAQISSADAVLIDTVRARASSDGEATLAFAAPAALADGRYAVDIFVEGERLTSASLIVGDIPIVDAEPVVAIDPPQAPVGARHKIAAAGLAAGQTFRLIILDPAGAEEYSAPSQADAAGEYRLTISSTEEDDAGVYAVELRADDGSELYASATFEITAGLAEPAMPSEPSARDDAPEASAAIEPQAAPIGSSHLITVRGLASSETVAFDVVYAGASVFQREKTANADGVVTLELVTDDEDQPGDYRVTVMRARGNQPGVVLTAMARAAPVEPAAIIGGAHLIRGSLDAGLARVVFEGEASQLVVISVTSEDFDPAVALIDRDDAELAFNNDARGQIAASIGPLRLPYSGAYELAISGAPLMMPQGAETGDFAVAIEPVALLPIAYDADVRFALSADAPTVYYALPVESGDRLTVSVDSGGRLDTQLQVVSPAGEELAFDDDSGPGFEAELSHLLFESAADCVLALSSFGGLTSGAGTISVSRNPAHSLDDGEAAITLTDKAIRDLVVFEAREEELLILHLEKLAGDVEDLYVKATIDGMEVMSYSTMGVPDELPLAFVTPMSGRVVVALEKFGFDDGIALAVSLERP